MTYRARVASFALALFLTSAAFAGQLGKPIQPVPESGKLPLIGFGEIRRGPREAPPAMVDLIVEFREPASGARSVRGEMRREAMVIRGEALQTRVAELRNDLARLDGDEPARVGRTFSRVLFGAGVRVRREAISAIAKLPYVAAVHVARQFEVQGDGTDKSYRSYRSHRSYQAQSFGTGITVAVLDTGIDYTHPALGGGFGPGFKVVGGWDFANDDADPMDDYGHGTHVAGIIAAEGDGLLGVAPGVSLYAYKVIAGDGYATEEDVIAGIERTVDPDGNHDPSDRIDIVNMSLGGRASEDDPVVAAVERAIAAGVVFCIANGNTASYGYVLSPAFAPSAISVGAAMRDGTVAAFSTRGPSYDYGIKPEVIAPGVDILSTVPGNKTMLASGTSMAAPYVAGIAALVKAQHPGWSPAELKAAVVSTARAVNEEVMVAGAGSVDVAAAAAVDTLASSAVLNFGQDVAKLEVWTSTRSVTLRNLSASQQVLTANVRGLRDGVAVVVTPGSVSLAPGASATVTVELKVTNAAVPAPRKGSLSYGGRIEWSGGAVPIGLPWAFVKGAYLSIRNPDGGFINALVIGESGMGGTGEFLDRARVFWPLEQVDVVVASFGYPTYVTVAEQVEVDGAPVVTTDVGSASLSVALDTTDENGNAIAGGGRECYEKHILSFPQGRRVGFMAQPQFRPLFTRLSPRIRIYPAHTCGDVAASTMYMALHEPIAGLEANAVSTSRPQWLRQDVDFKPDVPRSESMIGGVAMLRFAGPDSGFFYDGGQFFLMRGTESRLRILYTKSPGPEVDILMMLDWWGRCYDPGLGHLADCPLLDFIFLYLNEQTATAENEIFLDVSPMGYALPAGETMTFGESPVFPQVRFDFGRDAWGMVGLWYGPLGERRLRDTINARAAVYDANGTLMGEGPVGFSVEGALPPGRYRVESVFPDLFIAGLRGRATYTGWSDTTRGDYVLPLFTGLRIVDDQERQATIVDPDSRPSLLFSVADGIRGKVIYLERVPPNEEATRVEYRVHGTKGEWRPLPAMLTARHYRFSTYLIGGIGTMYRVDLGALAAELRGPVDLRITVEDKAGNTSELKLEPAFSVGKMPHRRSVRH
ncbi:MAG TPA: S8 family serine peptidase [Thermoanaerobaculia bacterium]|nr:S8 family serine peptidase [Thermoanaerobaculia bacterium]